MWSYLMGVQNTLENLGYFFLTLLIYFYLPDRGKETIADNLSPTTNNFIR